MRVFDILEFVDYDQTIDIDTSEGTIRYRDKEDIPFFMLTCEVAKNGIYTISQEVLGIQLKED